VIPTPFPDLKDGGGVVIVLLLTVSLILIVSAELIIEHQKMTLRKAQKQEGTLIAFPCGARPALIEHASLEYYIKKNSKQVQTSK
jgi:hypothetical protein